MKIVVNLECISLWERPLQKTAVRNSNFTTKTTTCRILKELKFLFDRMSEKLWRKPQYAIYTHTHRVYKGPGNRLGFFLFIFVTTYETHYVDAELKSLKLWLFKPERKKNPLFYQFCITEVNWELYFFFPFWEKKPILQWFQSFVTLHLKVEEVVSKYKPFAYKASKTYS